MIIHGKDLKANVIEKTEVCVIGSGAGGAVVAKELTEAGFQVTIIEEGGDFTPEDYTGRPIEMFPLLYRDGGLTVALGSPVVIIPLGRCLGGTTVVNSGTCFRCPDSILDRWNRELRLATVNPDSLSPHFARVENILNVSPAAPDTLGSNNLIFKRGAEALGYRGKPLSRNTRNCEGCGICAMGCQIGAKLDMRMTYVPSASEQGAQIYTNALADKIIFRNGHVAGISGKFIANGNHPTGYVFEIHSPIVILAAGALHTPVLLRNRRTGIRRSHIGKHLHIHPAIRVGALFEERIEGWKGIPQGYCVEEFEQEGIRIEGIFVPPDVASVMFPHIGIPHKETMSRFAHLSTFGLMISDTSTGRVYAGPGGRPLIFYQINREDTRRIVRGIKIMSEIYFAAGATTVFPHIFGFETLHSRNEISRIEEDRVHPTQLELSAFHPMGTCRMGTEPKTSVVNEHLEVYQAKGLFVSDASVFPSSLGVNPQITIMAFATRLADYLCEHRSRYF